jgi:hypothetical protein
VSCEFTIHNVNTLLSDLVSVNNYFASLPEQDAYKTLKGIECSPLSKRRRPTLQLQFYDAAKTSQL